MADIEGIKVLNLSSKKRAKDLSKKYDIPLINSKSAKTFDEYQEKYLFVDEATYKKNVGGIKSITSIPLTKF